MILTDPDHVFGFQNVAPVVNTKVLAKEGPAFAATLNKVDALLTFNAMQQLNKAVSIDQQTPAARGGGVPEGQRDRLTAAQGGDAGAAPARARSRGQSAAAISSKART